MGRPQVGLAYAPYVPALLRRRPGLIDYVEIPFERLRHDPSTAAVLAHAPAVLHCASLSVAGVVPAPPAVLAEVRRWVARTGTPWLGEHLAFVTAPDTDDTGADAGIVDVGYTVAPPLNATTLDRVVAACARYRRALEVPMLLENPPQYFVTPGTTMDQPAFLAELCRRSDVGLLLDVTHFLITARNLGLDPPAALEAIPLDRVREIHLSGMRIEMATAWDDHGTVASDEAFAMLARVLRRARPAAITLEYNWPAEFPEDVVVAELARVRRAVAAVRRS